MSPPSPRFASPLAGAYRCLGPSGHHLLERIEGGPERVGRLRLQHPTLGRTRASLVVQSVPILSVVAVDVAQDPIIEAAEHERNVREYRRYMAFQHPAFMAQFMHCVDAKTGEEFDFDLLTDEERLDIDLGGEQGPWFWHREVLELWMKQEVSLEYK